MTDQDDLVTLATYVAVSGARVGLAAAVDTAADGRRATVRPADRVEPPSAAGAPASVGSGLPPARAANAVPFGVPMPDGPSQPGPMLHRMPHELPLGASELDPLLFVSAGYELEPPHEDVAIARRRRLKGLTRPRL